MHQLPGMDDVSAKGLADTLVAEADPENGNLTGEALDDAHRDAGVLGCTGAG